MCYIVYNRLSSWTDAIERAKKWKNEDFVINAVTGGNDDGGDDPNKNFSAHVARHVANPKKGKKNMTDGPDKDGKHKYTAWLTNKSSLTSQSPQWEKYI